MANDSILIQVQLGSPTKANINAVTRQIQSALSTVSANVQISNGRQAAQQLQTIKNKTDSTTKSMNSFGEAIGLSGRRFLAFTSAVAVVGRLTSALSQATREAIKFEREFVKLAQVFDTDVKSLGRLQNSMSELAQEFGLSATVIAKTSVVLAQSGLNARQTEQAMRTLAKTTLAATFDSIAASTEGAVAIMAQFGTEASKLETQLGAINAVSKRFAVESGDIIEAIRRAGGAFRAAGGNLNEFISLFTAVRSTTRESAETIATGFRTIFARIQRPRTIEFFRQLNIELTDGRGNFIGAFKAVRRLSEGLKRAGIEAGSLRFAEVVEQLGGIRQVSRVIPLLQQFSKAEKARQVAVAGGGSLDRDAAKAQETLSQAFARTTENFRALIREISQTETFQAIVRIALDLANAFIEVARTLKPLIPLIAAFGAIKIGGLASGALKKGFGGAGGTGGLGQGFNRGGFVPGTGNSDTVPAMLTPGEFVIRKSAVQAFGADRLSRINKYAYGGRVADLGKIYTSIPRKRGYQGIKNRRLKDRSVFKKVTPTEEDLALWNSLKGPFGKRFEEVLSNKFPDLGQSDPYRYAFLDFPKARAEAKFMKRGETYNKGENDKNLKGNTNSSIAAKNLLYENSLIGGRKNKSATTLSTYALAKKPVTTYWANPEEWVRRSTGGSISGTGTDTVPALLTPGEFVINKKSAESFGYGNLRKINKYNKGGVVGVQKFKNGGEVSGGGRIADFGQRLFGLSFALSTLTATLDGVGEEFKVLTSGLATFAVSIAFTTSIIKKLGKEGPKLFSPTAKRVRSINKTRDKKGLDPLPFSRFSKSIVVAQAALLIFGTILAGMNAISQARLAQSELELKQAKESGNFAVIQEKARQKASNGINAKFLIALSAVTAGLFLLNPIAGSLAAVGTLVIASMKDVTPAINFVITNLYSFASAAADITTGLLKLANNLPFVNIDVSELDRLNAEIKNLAASGLTKFLPAVTKAEAALSALGEASSASVDQLVKNRERSQRAFGIAGTDAQKSRVLDGTIKSLKTDLGNLDSGIQSFDAAIAKTRKQFQQDLAAAGADPNLQQAARKRFADAEKKAIEERKTALQAENKERLTSIGQYAAQSRQIGEANRIQRDLNDGQKIQRDANNVITQQSLKDNSVLKNTFLALKAEGLSTEEALERLTASVDGSSNALAAFVGNLGARSKTLGDFLRKLTTGNIQDRIKAGRTVTQGAQAIRSGSLAQVPADQQSGVVDFIGQMYSLGAVSNQQARAIVDERVGADQMADIEEAIANRIRSQNPNETEEGIAREVAKQMEIVVAGFFGQDPIATANKIANEETAKNTKRAADAAEAQVAQKQPVKANAAGFAGGGSIFKPRGTDTVPAMLTPGEFVVQKSSVDKYGTGMMKSINAGTFSGGGIVNYLANGGALSEYGLSKGGKHVYQTGLDRIKKQTLLSSTVLGGVSYDQIIKDIEDAIAQDKRLTEERKKIFNKFYDRAISSEKALTASKKGKTFSKAHHRTGQSNEQSFSDKYAGELTFVERAFRPLTEAGTATFQGITGGLSVGIGAIGGGELYTKTGMERLNLAGQSAISAGTLGYAHEGTKKARERYNEHIDRTYTGTIGGVKLSTISGVTDAIGEAAISVAPEAGVLAGVSAVSKIGKGASAGAKAASAAAKGGKSNRVIAATEELARIDDVIVADTKYLKELKKSLKNAEKQADFEKATGGLGSKIDEFSIISKSQQVTRKSRPTFAEELPKLKQHIKQVESSIDTMRQTRQSKLSILKEMEQDDVLKAITKIDEFGDYLEISRGATKSDEVAKAAKVADVAVDAAKTGKVTALQRVGKVLKKTGDLGKGSLKLLIRAAIKAAGNKDALNLIDNFFRDDTVEEKPFKALVDEEAKKAVEKAITPKIDTDKGDQNAGDVESQRRKLMEEWIRIKYPTIQDRFDDEQAAIYGATGGNELGSRAARAWLYEQWRNPAIKPIIGNLGEFQRDAMKFRVDMVNNLGKKGKKQYLDQRIYGRQNKFDYDFENAKPGQTVLQRHSGGIVPGVAQTPLYAQGGEFVMQRSAVNRIGAGNLHYMNNGGNVPANGTMNVMGGESLNDAAGKLENALSNHAIPETINVQLGNLSVDIGGNVLPGMETMVKEAIAEALMDYENTKDTDNSPGSYGRSVAQERFGNTA